MIAEPTTRQPWAAVFDIDETLLLNLPNDAVKQNPATIKVVQWLRDHNVKLFAVTARSFTEASRHYALEQLRAVGHTDYDEESIFLTFSNYEPYSRSWFKYQARKRIVAQGYHLLLNAGDNFSDLFVLKEHDPDVLVDVDEIDGHHLLDGVDLSVLENKYANKSKQYLFEMDIRWPQSSGHVQTKLRKYYTSRLSWKLPNSEYTVK